MFANIAKKPVALKRVQRARLFARKRERFLCRTMFATAADTALSRVRSVSSIVDPSRCLMPAALSSAHFVTIDKRADSFRPARRSVLPNRSYSADSMICAHARRKGWSNLQTKRLRRRATLRSDRDERPRHSRILSNSRRTGGVRPSAKTAGSDNLFKICVDCSLRDRNRLAHCDTAGIRIFILMNTPASEQRLEQLREKAWQEGVVPGRGVDVVGGPIPRKPGYYGEPVVKPPVWTWEVPLYFFFGGIGGMSAVIAFGAVLFHHVDLARAAMWIAAIAGAVLSPILTDHGSRPSASFPQHAARFQTSLCHVDGRVDSDSIWYAARFRG